MRASSRRSSDTLRRGFRRYAPRCEGLAVRGERHRIQRTQQAQPAQFGGEAAPFFARGRGQEARRIWHGLRNFRRNSPQMPPFARVAAQFMNSGRKPSHVKCPQIEVCGRWPAGWPRIIAPLSARPASRFEIIAGANVEAPPRRENAKSQFFAYAPHPLGSLGQKPCGQRPIARAPSVQRSLRCTPQPGRETYLERRRPCASGQAHASARFAHPRCLSGEFTGYVL